MVRVGDDVDFLAVRRDPGQRPDMYDAFQRERDSVTVRVRYCSVLDDCWARPQDGSTPATAPPLSRSAV